MLFPHGLDYGWIGLDRSLCVGFFTNGGQGPIPVAVLAARPIADEAEELVLQLPDRGGGIALVDTPSVPDAFTRFADRGLVVYDWQDVHHITPEETGCYELVARPRIGLTLAELRQDVARLASLVPLDAFLFEETTEIPLAQYISVALPDDP